MSLAHSLVPLPKNGAEIAPTKEPGTAILAGPFRAIRFRHYFKKQLRKTEVRIMQVRHPMLSLHKLSLLLNRPKPIPALDMADDRLSDDTIVPEQFSRPPGIASKACREAALMQAVLAEAVSCFQRGTIIKG